MSGSQRRRKSQWDSNEGTQLSFKNSEDSTWHGPKWSDLEANDALKSKESSERRSWESSQENYGQKDNRINRDVNEIPVTTRSWDEDRVYRVSPGHNGRGRRNHSRSPENSLNQPRRHRSRSRDRGQRRSRSRSRGRGKGEDRDRDRDRDDMTWSRSQSRSPFHDRRREPYGRGDRRSGPALQSPPCKDFSVGKCRRGSQCRFLHQDNLNQMEGGRSERDRPERLRSRQEHREPMVYPPDKSSDGYGNYDRRGGNAPYDHDVNRHPRRGGNSIPLCRFFAAGKCSRDNCRFSHDGPVSGNLERSSVDDRDGYNSVEKSKPWTDPKWGDDANGVSDGDKFTGWGESNVGNIDYPNQRTAERQPDDRWGSNLDEQNKLLGGPKLAAEKPTNERWGHSLDNQSGILSSPARRGEASGRDGYVSPHWGYDDRGANVGPSESAGVTESFCREESLLVLEGFESQSLGGISTNIAEQNVAQEASEVSKNYNVHQFDRQEENPFGTNESDALGVNISGNVPNPGIMSGLTFKQNGDNDHNMGIRPSGLVGTDPSGHMTTRSPPRRPMQMFSHLNLQSQNEINHRESFKPFEMLQSHAPQVNSEIPQNVPTSDQLAQTPNLSVSLTQIFGNGQQLPQLYAALNPPNPIGTVPSLPNSASFAPPVVSLDGSSDPATKSKEQRDPFGDGIEPNHPGNDTHEQENPVSSKPIQNSEVVESDKATVDKFKGEQENIHPESVNEDGKVGEGNSGKDDKEMRLFKVALVEFVKEVLKPTWKEGQLSREVHKTIVKKVVDKVTSTIQGIHVPKTPEKIDLYLSYSKPKITKLVQAYVERLSKT